MAERNEHSDADAWLAALRKLRREMESLRRSLERAEERADGIQQNLIAFEQKILAGCVGTPACAPPELAIRRTSSEKSLLLNLAAQSGVEGLEIKRLANGEASVRIAGGKAFKLSATLTALLETLALETANDDGNLVGWKSLPDVMGHMQKRMGRPYSPQAIHQLVWRLRSALADSGGVNPQLVQTHRQFGLRFAVRRPSREKSV